MQVETWPIDRLIPYDKNPRLNDDAVEAVSRSIQEFGFRQPIVVDAEGVIIIGHTRLKAAKKLGLTDVPVHVARGLSPEKIKALRIADNKTAEIAEWNLELLPIELSELQGMDFDLGLLGFDQDELAKLLDPGVQEGMTDPDEIPAPPDEAITKPGDLWILGEHRLLCGDSSKPEDLDRLLDGQPIHLANTDPPYNVKVEPRSNNAIAAGLSSFQGTTHHQSMDVARHPEKSKPTQKKLRAKDRPLANDFVSDDEFDRLLDAWFGNIARVLVPGRGFYIWGGYANLGNYPPFLKKHGLYFSQAVVWDKQHPVLTRKDMMGCFELAFYGWKEGAAHEFLGPNNATDLWHVKKVNPQNMVHLTEKPVELAVRAMQFSSRTGENVLDLFGGSGSTHIGWTAKYIVLPTLEPNGWSHNESLGTLVREDGRSLASGAVIKVAGITGRIRGMKFKRPDGKSVRPSLVVLDDPQTDESARSVSQCQQRESILAGAVLGLAGPGHKISGIMPCTVIRPGDMADRILNRDHHPQWQGERTKMVYAFPSEAKLWDRYAELRAEGLRNEDGGQGATDFYAQHQEQMDAGARIAWPERFNHDELSAIQHAMNLKLQDEAAFWAEYQNEPLPEVEVDENELTADQIAANLNGLPKGRVPLGCQHLTMFIDVQQKLLFYVVCAWGEEFSGAVLEYGAWPDPQRAYFSLRDVTKTLSTVAAGTGLEGAIYAGLQALTDKQLSREWQREDGASLRIERCLIDANWGTSTDVVYQFCRQSPHAALLLPSHGRFVGASSLPFSDYKRRPGDRVGLNWRIPAMTGKRAMRHVTYDTNFWKSFTFARLAVAMADKGSLSLFGQKPEAHRLFAEHLVAEYRVRTEGRGRTVDEWKQRPSQPDNHWLDGLVGNAVAASILGVQLSEHQGNGPVKQRGRIKLSDLKRRHS